MGKAIGGLPEAPPLSAPQGGAGREGPPGGVEPIGAYLSRQRRLRGISLDELAELTRIPRRSLERLEGGAFDAQPDGFVRGFVRTVALAIGLDPIETVTRMLPEVGMRAPRVWPELRRAGLVVLAALVLAAVVAGGGALWRGLAAATAEDPASPARVRRDAVRALAIARGLLPHDASSPAQPLTPEERLEREAEPALDGPPSQAARPEREAAASSLPPAE